MNLDLDEDATELYNIIYIHGAKEILERFKELFPNQFEKLLIASLEFHKK